jgi:hypothetical protein
VACDSSPAGPHFIANQADIFANPADIFSNQADIFPYQE